MSELKPFTALLAGLLAGGLVSGHIIDPANRQPVQDLLDSFFGGLILLTTIGATLYHYVIKHGTQQTSTTTTATVEQKTTQPVPQAVPSTSPTIEVDQPVG